MNEIRRRARIYCDAELAKERERLWLEREQMERWKTYRREKRRENWRAKMAERERVESQERADRARLEAEKMEVWKAKTEARIAGRREWLQCIKEEIHKFDLSDLPLLVKLRNYKYDTYQGKHWYTKHN